MTAINEGRSMVWKESKQQERCSGFEETGTRQRAGEARVKGKEARGRLKVEPGWVVVRQIGPHVCAVRQAEST
jgi:hypothetical protein